MRASRINFAPRSLARALAATGPLCWVAGAAGVALCAGALATVFELSQQSYAQQSELGRIQGQIAQRAARKPGARPSPISDLQAGAVNRAISQLNLPWHDVLQAIEAATPAAIALLALEPDAKTHRIKAMAEAKNSDDMFAYLASLNRQAFFNAVVLTRHDINEQDPNRPIRFQFEAEWIQGAP
jgi:Tfp pilus assembly protein PilN